MLCADKKMSSTADEVFYLGDDVQCYSKDIMQKIILLYTCYMLCPTKHFVNTNTKKIPQKIFDDFFLHLLKFQFGLSLALY